MHLESSNSTVNKTPDKSAIEKAVREVGNGLEFVILTGDPDFIQTATTPGGLMVEYHDGRGRSESAAGPIATETVVTAFLDFFEGKGSWRGSMQFSPNAADESSVSASKTEAGFSISSIVGLAVRQIIRKFFG